jgi:hypothetical protein
MILGAICYLCVIVMMQKKHTQKAHTKESITSVAYSGKKPVIKIALN